MNGDFSTRPLLLEPNFAGVLYQQGRVFFDADGNAETGITGAWQDTAARDTMGADVAAVPTDSRDSFRVERADLIAPAAPLPYATQLQVTPGRVWADGVLVHLTDPAPAIRLATPLELPFQ